MAQLNEWGKGIGLFIVTTLLFYFFWDNIFSNIITWVGTDMMNLGSEASSSLTILKSFAWTSFILVYITTCPLYLIYTIIVGSRNDVKTEPLMILKGIGIWVVSMVALIVVLGIMFTFIESMNTATSGMINDTEGLAEKFSWIITLISMILILIYPFICIIKGYGLQMLEKEGDG